MADEAVAMMSSCEIKELGSSSEILKLLECPICQGIPIPPIWNCNGGHIVCDQCRIQLHNCGLCRASFSGGRNFFMESIVYGCTLTCPYSEAGCTEVCKGDLMKAHATNCKFGPKIKWIACQHGHYPESPVQGGTQNGVKLFVVRATHRGSNTPGKLYEYTPAGSDPDVYNCSLAWGGGEHVKASYEVLVAPPGCVEWIPSVGGELVQFAVPGGTSEMGEPLFIGRVKYGDDIINGKIHPSHRCCYIGVNGTERGFNSYEILVTVQEPLASTTEGESQTTNGSRNRRRPQPPPSEDSSSMYYS